MLFRSEVISDTSSAETTTNQTILAPVTGRIIPLEEIDDHTFASGTLGQGVGIIPNEDLFKSPFFGRVEFIFETGHALGLVSNEGLELLLHIGIDTVKLNGKYFDVLVKEGDFITPATDLIRIDRDKIVEEGFSLTSPIVITNIDQYNDINILKTGECVCGDAIFEIR